MGANTLEVCCAIRSARLATIALALAALAAGAGCGSSASPTPMAAAPTLATRALAALPASTTAAPIGSATPLVITSSPANPVAPTPSPSALPSGYELQSPMPTAANGYPAPYNPPTPTVPTPTPIVAPTLPIAPNAISPANAGNLQLASPVAPPSFEGASGMLALTKPGADPILDAAFSADGGRLAVAKAYGIFVYDLRAPRPLRFIDTADAIPLRIFFTPSADRLLVSSHDDFEFGPRGTTFFDIASGQRSGIIRWPSSVNGIDSTIARLSPDGRSLLIQQNFGAALYDAATLRPLPFWPRAFAAATFAFSPDSRLLATGFGAVTVSDLATSNVAFNATQRGTAANEVPAVAFSPDGSLFVTTDTRRLVVWDVAGRHELFDVPFVGRTDYWIGTLAIAPNNQMLAAAHEGRVAAWRLPGGELAIKADGTGALFSPDGATLLIPTAAHLMGVWDVASGQERLELSGDAPQFARDGRLLIQVAAADYAFADVRTGQAQPAFAAVRPRFAPDGQLVDIGDDGSVRLLDGAGQQMQAMGLAPQHSPMTSVAYRRDGQLMMAYGNGTVREQTSDPQLVNNALAAAEQGGWIYQLVVAPDGATIFAASKDGTVLRVDPNSLYDVESRVSFGGQPGELTSVAVSPDGLLLAAGSSDGTIKLWNTAEHASTGSVQPWQASPPVLTQTQTLVGHNNWVWSVAFAPDGRQLASGSADQTVRIWDPNTGTTIRVVTGHTGAVHSVAYSPDGLLIASGGWDGTVRLWNAGSGALLRVLIVGADKVNQVAFSRDGQVLAAGVDDGTVRLWESATGRDLATLHSAAGAVWGISFSPDGQRLAAAMNDGKAQVWEAP